MAGSRYLEPLLTGRRLWKYRALVALWLGLILYFWAWWLQPAHNIDGFRYAVAASALAWITFLQLYFLMIFMRASRPVGDLADLGDARVAMIVTKSPGEPFDLVRETLEAMLAQSFPHDTWLADEDPAPETVAWCEAHGVKISSRKGVKDYHRSEWPRRTRCKEGNLAYFYDHFGYAAYDFVCQLDADHVPQKGYLREMLRPFIDPEVGYVSAPSICASNAETSWAARTRLFAEGAFHGALQAGYSNGWAPMCIGSHYAVRTRALKEIGGLGPELAEDHSTSMMMNAHGWRGVHAIDAIAVGAGPEQFSDMLTQEFQWSRSLVTILLRYTPRYLRGLPPRLKFQFVFSQLWYPFFAGFMAITFAVPIWALTLDARFADVTYPGFIGHAAPATAVLIWIAYEIRRDGWFRPRNAGVIAWERTLFAIAQWPWVLWGCVMAVRDRLTGGFVDFRITPKGRNSTGPPPALVLAPYVVLCLASLAPVVLAGNVREAAGFYIFSLFNAALYSALLIVVLARAASRTHDLSVADTLRFGGRFLVVAALVASTGYAVWLRGMTSLHALSSGLGPLRVVEARYVVSGAGRRAGEIRYIFNPRWVSPLGP